MSDDKRYSAREIPTSAASTAAALATHSQYGSRSDAIVSGAIRRPYAFGSSDRSRYAREPNRSQLTDSVMRARLARTPQTAQRARPVRNSGSRPTATGGAYS